MKALDAFGVHRYFGQPATRKTHWRRYRAVARGILASTAIAIGGE